MNRAFKIEFHNGYPDEKPIVTMSVRVNNGTRFNKLDDDGKTALVSQLSAFVNAVMAFRNEIDSTLHESCIKNNARDAGKGHSRR